MNDSNGISNIGQYTRITQENSSTDVRLRCKNKHFTNRHSLVILRCLLPQVPACQQC